MGLKFLFFVFGQIIAQSTRLDEQIPNLPLVSHKTQN